MPTFTVSDGALALLKRNLTGPQILVTDENREAYRELAGAGLMIPLHTFTHGDESAYRLTEAGVNFARAEVERCSSQQPSVPSNRPASRRIRRLPSLIGLSVSGASLRAASWVPASASASS